MSLKKGGVLSYRNIARSRVKRGTMLKGAPGMVIWRCIYEVSE